MDTETRHETIAALMRHLEQAMDLADQLMAHEERGTEAWGEATSVIRMIAHAQDALRDYDAVQS